MITMEQAKRYGNIHTEIMIDNELIHDKEIRGPLFDSKKDSPYEAVESCISLIGTRKTTRYKDIEVECTDLQWNRKSIGTPGSFRRSSGMIAIIWRGSSSESAGNDTSKV